MLQAKIYRLYKNGDSAKCFSVFCNDKDFLRVVHPFLDRMAGSDQLRNMQKNETIKKKAEEIGAFFRSRT